MDGRAEKCIWCGGKAVFLGFAGVGYYCPHCEDKLTKDEVINDMTLFDRITQSPETLAEKFIFKEWHPIARRNVWYSLLLNSEERLIYAPSFETKQEAFAATVAKLKEVMK